MNLEEENARLRSELAALETAVRDHAREVEAHYCRSEIPASALPCLDAVDEINARLWSALKWREKKAGERLPPPADGRPDDEVFTHGSVIVWALRDGAQKDLADLVAELRRTRSENVRLGWRVSELEEAVREHEHRMHFVHGEASEEDVRLWRIARARPADREKEMS